MESWKSFKYFDGGIIKEIEHTYNFNFGSKYRLNRKTSPCRYTYCCDTVNSKATLCEETRFYAIETPIQQDPENRKTSKRKRPIKKMENNKQDKAPKNDMPPTETDGANPEKKIKPPYMIVHNLGTYEEYVSKKNDIYKTRDLKELSHERWEEHRRDPNRARHRDDRERGDGRPPRDPRVPVPEASGNRPATPKPRASRDPRLGARTPNTTPSRDPRTAESTPSANVQEPTTSSDEANSNERNEVNEASPNPPLPPGRPPATPPLPEIPEPEPEPGPSNLPEAGSQNVPAPGYSPEPSYSLESSHIRPSHIMTTSANMLSSAPQPIPSQAYFPSNAQGASATSSFAASVMPFSLPGASSSLGVGQYQPRYNSYNYNNYNNYSSYNNYNYNYNFENYNNFNTYNSFNNYSMAAQALPFPVSSGSSSGAGQIRPLLAQPAVPPMPVQPPPGIQHPQHPPPVVHTFHLLAINENGFVTLHHRINAGNDQDNREVQHITITGNTNMVPLDVTFIMGPNNANGQN